MLRFLLIALLSTLAATPGSPGAAAEAPQVRGVWVDGFNPGIKSRAEVDTLVERVQRARCNAIFAQVRKRGDAYYWSRYEPRAADFADPGYDPLAYLVERAHAATPPISVHAWVNMGAVGTPTRPEHVLAKHPDWRSLSDGGGDDPESAKIDPGVPGASDWTFRVYLDILRQYRVDGIHFDFVRYGGPRWGYAPESVARFNARHGRTGAPAFDDPLWQEWRREQVTNLVRKVYAHAAAVRPDAVVSAATITWGDAPRAEEDWKNTAAYSQVFQDWRAWLEEGILDLACPMTYFRETPHRTFQENWAAWVKGHQYGRAATLAVATYLNPSPSSLTLARINLAPDDRGRTAAGVLFYSYSGQSALPEERGKAFGQFATLFSAPAPFPTFAWKAAPTAGHVKGFALAGGNLTAADGATVTLTPLTPGGVPVTRRADGTGFFAFVNLPPGEYHVSASYGGEIRPPARVRVTAGGVSSANFLFSEGDTPPLRRAAELGGLPDGAPVRLTGWRVTVGTDALSGTRCFLAEGAGRTVLEARFAVSPTLPLVSGDRVTLVGTLRRAEGRSYVQVGAATLTDMGR